MSDGLQDVISAASGAVDRCGKVEPRPRRVPKLRAVDSGRPDSPAPGDAPRLATSDAGSDLGWGGLRLAFWLGGLQEALQERAARGEKLSERETSLTALTDRDFAALRPSVIAMVIGRLEEILASPRFDSKADAICANTQVASFAIETLRNLSEKASTLLKNSGPDEAIALFGATPAVVQPVAIYRLVFNTALDILDSFHRLQPTRSDLMQTLAEALETAIERA